MPRNPVPPFDPPPDPDLVLPDDDGTVSLPPLAPGWEEAISDSVAAFADAATNATADAAARNADDDDLDPAVDPHVVGDLGALTGQLCQAVGLDPEKVQGFRLTVFGGQFPQLEVWHLPPVTENGDLLDMWVSPLARRMADVTLLALPGSGSTAPPAQPRPLPFPAGVDAPAGLQAEQWLADRLPQLVAAVNGAPLDADTRERLSATAHGVAEVMAGRVYDGMGLGLADGGSGA